MQPMKYLVNWLDQHANNEHYLFRLQDLRALCPDLSCSTFKTLLSRTARAGYLNRVCRGLYIYKRAISPSGLVLFHAAALLRADEFNYISLETALSDAGVISQIPMNWIAIMSSGRSNIVSCGEYGTIEFVHTSQKPDQIMNQLSYDADCRLWRATVPLALRDMKATHRNCDLIDWDIANEFI
jgi:predicted transcriptional regulator of viral defense system